MTNTQTGTKSRFLLLSVLFIILNIADVILTRFALDNGLHEANPILASNLDFLVPLKIVGIFIILALAYLCERKFNFNKSLIAPIMLYGFVVIWNAAQIINSGVI